MTAGNIAQRTTSRPATRPSAGELEHYLADHTIDQAARRWKVHPRTIHKWRQRTPTSAEQPQETCTDDSPTFIPTSDDIAGDGTMWRDPWTGELMPVPPGAHRKAWEAERIAARDRHKAAVQAALAPVPEVEAQCPAVDVTSSQGEEPAPKLTEVDAMPVDAPVPSVPDGHTVPLQNIALQSHEATVPGTPMYRPQYTPMPEQVRVVRERVVIREREPVGLVAFVREHPIFAHQAVAVVIVAILIYIANFG